jgi:dolichol-phosphate mannosyltransferase
MADASIILSVVIPCYHEEDSLPVLLDIIPAKLNEITAGLWEIIFVDDGSHDRTIDIIKEAYARDQRIKGIQLSRNFGHQPALSVGLDFASGEYCGVMDCDLQDPVEVLVEMYRKCRDEGYDVCYGVRQNRDAPVFLKIGYKLFYRLMHKFSEHSWPLDAGDFCVINRKAKKALLLLPEKIRMLRGLRAWIGLKQAGVPYSRPSRAYGTSKYNFFKLMGLAMRGFTGFSSLPLRLASLIGFALGSLSLIGAGLIVVNRLFPTFSLFGYWIGANPAAATIAVLLCLMNSAILISLGIIGEYINILVKEVKQRPTAIVSDFIGMTCQSNQQSTSTIIV